MKTSVTNIIAFSLSILVLGGSSLSASQQSDQIAVHLGAIQLGIPDLASASDQQKANALAQGRLALGATQAKFNPDSFVEGAVTPSPQSEAFRTQLLQAVQKALTAPLNGSISGNVALQNGKQSKVNAVLDPALTTASAILDFALKRIPNTGPGLAIAAIEAAVASPQKFGAPGTGVADANKAAGIAMNLALRTYAKGTRQWGPTSTTPPSLPNFSGKPVNGVAPSLNGLMDAAAATAANAINALGSALKDDPDVVAGITASLVKSAARFQKISQTPPEGTPARFGGTAGATATALVSQVAGNAQADWTNATSGDLLNAIVSGAMKAAKRQVVAVAYGAAAGFAGTFVATGGSQAAFDINAVAAKILASFKETKAVKASNEVSVNAAILAGLNVGLDQANWNDAADGVAGIGGIKDFTVVNGSGTPLTDTVGL